jgi:predicted glycoside hydrolase/deacetylase ChbG (UPF0249 family)
MFFHITLKTYLKVTAHHPTHFDQHWHLKSFLKIAEIFINYFKCLMVTNVGRDMLCHVEKLFNKF